MTGPAVSMSSPVRRAFGSGKRAVLERAARSYLAGPSLADALAAAEVLGARGFAVTLAYWNPIGQPAAEVADEYLAAVRAAAGLCARDRPGAARARYAGPFVDVAIKVPALECAAALVEEIGAAARVSGTRLWFDSHGTEVADATLQLAATAAAGGTWVGVALPARWRRSMADAERLGPLLDGRLVKGQWPDMAGPVSDVGDRYLALVDRLAGGTRFVGVATHDPAMLDRALRRLRTAGTSAEVQLLAGLPARRALRVAGAADAAVRIYVPFGAAYLMYSPRTIWENRRIALWLTRDIVTGAGRRRLERLTRR